MPVDPTTLTDDEYLKEVEHTVQKLVQATKNLIDVTDEPKFQEEFESLPAQEKAAIESSILDVKDILDRCLRAMDEQ